MIVIQYVYIHIRRGVQEGCSFIYKVKAIQWYYDSKIVSQKCSV